MEKSVIENPSQESDVPNVDLNNQPWLTWTSKIVLKKKKDRYGVFLFPELKLPGRPTEGVQQGVEFESG